MKRTEEDAKKRKKRPSTHVKLQLASFSSAIKETGSSFGAKGCKGGWNNIYRERERLHVRKEKKVRARS